MSRYADLLGKRVEVIYRAGDIHLPATASLAGDTGKSIFLEEHILHHNTMKTFRWEIPYQHIIRIHECVLAGVSGKPPAEKAAAPAIALSELPEKA
jgi:hypothetical protein